MAQELVLIPKLKYEHLLLKSRNTDTSCETTKYQEQKGGEILTENENQDTGFEAPNQQKAEQKPTKTFNKKKLFVKRSFNGLKEKPIVKKKQKNPKWIVYNV